MQAGHALHLIRAALPLSNAEAQERVEVVWIRAQHQFAMLRGLLHRWIRRLMAHTHL